MKKYFYSIGLMSGTSIDGIDVSLIKSDGEGNIKIIDNIYQKYNTKFRNKIKKYIDLCYSKYQFMGIVYIPKGLKKKILDKYDKVKNNKKLHTTNFLDYLIKRKINVKAIKYSKDWYEFDDNEDFLNFKNYKW